MTRTIALRLLGVFLLLYGLSAVLVSWWAYSITHEAYSNVRSFTTAFERERNAAAEALQRATGLLGGGQSGPAGSAAGGAALVQGAQGLRETLSGLFGGQSRQQGNAPPA